MNEFYSCDWGTTSFRLRRARLPEGRVLAEIQDGAGVRSLSSQCPAGDRMAREGVFARCLADRLRSIDDLKNPIHVIISGMASSSVGWRELPYSTVPCPLDGSTLRVESFELDLGNAVGANIHLISGLRTDNEIMRGEESEIVGIFSENAYPDLANNGILVLPGTHSKHIRLRNREIETFHTYMTGELFDVLATNSLLRASVTVGQEGFQEPERRAAFVDGVRRSQNPGLAASLFQVRTRTVLSGICPDVNRWFLSGLLIGGEIKNLSSAGENVPVLLGATEPVSALYQQAFQTIGLSDNLVVIPPNEMKFASLRGHRTLLQRFGIP